MADEPAHLMRTASLIDGQLIAHREFQSLPDGRVASAAGVTVDPVWRSLSRTRDFDDPRHPMRLSVPTPQDLPWSLKPAFFPIYTIGTYCPIFYLPAALGLGAGRAAGLGPYWAARLGRLAAALAYAALALATLALARRERVLLFGLLALPMSLSLAGSYNHDGLIIAASALAVALATRGWDTASCGRLQPSTVGAAVLIALIVLAKPPYAPLAALLLVPLSRTRGAILRTLILASLALLPGLIWAGYAAAFVATPVPRLPYEAGPLWLGSRPALFDGTDPGAQLRVLLAEPSRFLTIPATYLATLKHILWLGAGAIGILGWLDCPLPPFLYVAWFVALCGAALARDHRRAELRGRDSALLAIATLVCLWAIVLSQYLTWTNVGYARVDGPQGRYLLPLLPLLVPCIRGLGPLREVRLFGALPYVAAALGGLIPWFMA
ncbi:DUF2142 domain-containing protein [Methylobacterium organophilum]|uniref:DUF2142 domain-containing protein n=1 Tax=Methylobacterium organophilum TaxID=410 RepID=UPI001F145EB8|nr:DUF2142 domain-containing protein [Methylobacterium organophilum]UMY19159.1 DUF2142 domain-containing protein [Methylobacterium organophilum]